MAALRVAAGVAIGIAAFASAGAAELEWSDIGTGTARLLAGAGVDRGSFADWKTRWRAAVRERLEEGTAEHAGYFILQSKRLGDEPLRPDAASADFILTLTPADRRAFLAGSAVAATLPATIRERMARFWEGKPVDERHRVLRQMAGNLGPTWSHERIVQQALRFAAQRSRTDDVDTLFQQRGLSGDPYPPSMIAVESGLAWLRANRRFEPRRIALIGPGIELGSRFGVDDDRPVLPPQPAALRKLVGDAPMACMDIRPEIVAVLRGTACAPSQGDVVLDAWQQQANLVVATNVLVYLDDVALTVAFANLARNMAPGGCLIHNDARFAARAAGEAAGLPVVHFAAVSLGKRGSSERMDRAVVHCKAH